MKLRLSAVLSLLVASIAGLSFAAEQAVAPALNFTMNRLDGKSEKLANYQGKVILIVNTASQCGLTKQYKQLQALHQKYAEQGLVILGFPANEFGAQEPGSNSEISTFCTKNYGVKFPMFEKVVVKGEGQCPLYHFLTSKETNPQFSGDIKWNFEKFLINRKGEVIARFEPRISPDDRRVVAAIEKELHAK